MFNNDPLGNAMRRLCVDKKVGPRRDVQEFAGGLQDYFGVSYQMEMLQGGFRYMKNDSHNVTPATYQTSALWIFCDYGPQPFPLGERSAS